jgi:Mycothiol maleylpyruvate isomerase N-terminal domain
MLPAPMLCATDGRRDHVTTAPDEAMDLAEVLAAEDARWAEMHALIGGLTPDQVIRPGYYVEGWSVKDLLAHVGTWLAEAGMMLERIAAGTYHAEELDIDAVNERALDAMHDIAFPVVTAQASAARARMRYALVELREPSSDATWWIRKAGPDHYDQHLPRLREWVEALAAG